MSTVRPYSERVDVKPPKSPEIGPAPEHPETALRGLDPKPSAPPASVDERFPGEAAGRAMGGGKDTCDTTEEAFEEGDGVPLETRSVVSVSDLMFDGASVTTYEGESICTPPAEMSLVEKARTANTLAEALKEFTGDAGTTLLKKVATRIVSISPTSDLDILIEKAASFALQASSSKEVDLLFGIQLLSDPKVLEQIANGECIEPAAKPAAPETLRKKTAVTYTQELYQDLKTDPETAKVLQSLGITDENFEHRFTVFSAKDPVLRRYYAGKNTEKVKETLIQIYIKDFLTISEKIDNLRSIREFLPFEFEKLSPKKQVEEIEKVLTERGNFLEFIKEINARDEHALRILPVCFTKIKSLEEIDLTGSRITFLPDEVGECVSLKKLFAYETDLEALPRSIGNLKALELLAAGTTKLKSLPEEIGECISLKELYVWSTDLESLPRSIGNLKALEHLETQRTKLKSLPEEIGECVSLKELSAWETDIEALPRSIGKLNELKKLHACKTLLKSIPDEIGECTSLIELYVWETDIESLPPSIGNLKALERLGARTTKLKSLPEEIGECTSLIELNVWDSDLKSLPRSIGKLKSLEHLGARSTKLKSLPEEIGECISLKELYIWDTDIESLPTTIGNLKALEHLGARSTKLKSLPEEIGECISLKELYIWETDIESLPRSIGNLKALEQLGARSTKLKSLPEEIGECISLKELFVWDTHIEAIPESIKYLRELKTLKVYATKIPGPIRLPESLRQREGLSILTGPESDPHREAVEFYRGSRCTIA